MELSLLKVIAAGAGLLLTFAGGVVIAWFDIFAKFDGQPYRTIVPLGGIGHTHKSPTFERWEHKRVRAMRAGLVLVALGTALGLIGLPF